MSEVFLFSVFPYVAFALAVIFGLRRYYADRFTYSSLSSQFLENRALFWGAVPWHYGIILILLAHLFGGLFPQAGVEILRDPYRRWILEFIFLGLAFLAGAGILVLIARRIGGSPVRAVTSVMDWILLASLLVQVAAGISIALAYRWGSVWYMDTAAPWFWSIGRFAPDSSPLHPLPWVVKLHAFNGFVLILLFPFTRLVHIFTVPLSYLWRPFQVVIWNRPPLEWTALEAASAPPIPEAALPAAPRAPRVLSAAEVSRRSVLKWATSILSLLVGLAVIIPLIAAVLGPIFRARKLEWTKVADLPSLPQEQPADVDFPLETVDAYIRKTETHRVWVIKHSPSSVTVFSPICPHLGCHYNWNPKTGHFECPCHGSVYTMNGQVIGGPAPRPLDTLPVRIEGSSLYIEWETFRVGIPQKIRV